MISPLNYNVQIRAQTFLPLYIEIIILVFEIFHNLFLLVIKIIFPSVCIYSALEGTCPRALINAFSVCLPVSNCDTTRFKGLINAPEI